MLETIQQQLANKLYELLPHKKEFESHYFKGNNLRCSNCGATAQEEFDRVPCNKIRYLPLRLADLLMAIEITNSDYSKSNRPYNIHLDFQATWIEGKHLLITHALGDPLLNKEGQYNLSKDNILNQSDELCKFALELLTTPPMAK